MLGMQHLANFQYKLHQISILQCSYHRMVPKQSNFEYFIGMPRFSLHRNVYRDSLVDHWVYFSVSAEQHMDVGPCEQSMETKARHGYEYTRNSSALYYSMLRAVREWRLDEICVKNLHIVDFKHCRWRSKWSASIFRRLSNILACSVTNLRHG